MPTKSSEDFSSTITPFIKWMITITVMLAAMIEIIDTTIVNVVLNDMSGSLGASTSEITWVITAYLVSAAIVMPLTGYLVNVFGRRRLFIINIVGFLIASMLCGIADTMSEMIIFRILQGIFGASLVPLSQYVLRDTFPPKEQVKAMAIWGMGIMAAPVLGPTIGGIVTEAVNWRWVFYINLPICLIALVMVLMFIPETKRIKIKTDWLGMGLLATAISALQIFLDKGNDDDWFQSTTIVILTFVWFFAFVIFIYRGLKVKNHIINLKTYVDKNYLGGNVLLFIYTGMLFGVLTLQPLIMQQVLGYMPKLTGMIMAPRGLAAALTMMLVAPLSKKIDLRVLIVIGILVTSWGLWEYSFITPQVDSWFLIWPSIIQGIGMGLFFVPVSAIALATLKRKDIAEASGMFSLSRAMGTSVGISLLITLYTRMQQTSSQDLSGNIIVGQANVTNYLQVTGHDSISTTVLAQINGVIQQQAAIISFADVCYFSSILLLLSLPFILLLSNINKEK